MLASSHICTVQSQKFKMLQTSWMNKTIPGNNISVLMSLNQMFKEDTSLAYQYACEAYKVFIAQKRCTEDDFTSSYALLANYGVALSSLFFAYELKTGKMQLYTSSLTILKQLATQNFLKGKKQPIAIELQDIEKKLYDSDRIKKSIKDGNKLISVRLDSEVVGNSVVFTPTIPRSAIDLNDFIIVPFLAVNEAMTNLNGVLQEKVLRITQGDKVRIVTKNIQLLSSIYGASRAQYLVSQVPDARVLRFYLPSLGASIYTAGITNIHLEKIDSIEVVNSLAEIDLSEIKLDYSQAKDFFMDTLKRLSAKDVHVIADALNTEQYNATAKERRKEVADIIDNLYDREVYDFMKQYPQYFNLGVYKTLPSKYGDKNEDLPIPNSIEELRGIFEKGVYKVLVNNRTGSMSTIICSNDSKCLEKIYGKKYYRNYESEGNRLRALLAEVKKLKEKYKANNTNSLEENKASKLFAKYNLSDVFEDVKESDKINTKENVKKRDINAAFDRYLERDSIPFDLLIKAINARLMDVEMRKTVIQQPHLVTVRSCEAKLDDDKNPVGFYRSIDLKSIITITRLSDGVVSESKKKK